MATPDIIVQVKGVKTTAILSTIGQQGPQGPAGAAGGATDQFARDQANAAFSKANTANVTGQAAFDKANGAIYTAAQIRANISNTAPINYDSTTGIISHVDSGAVATTYGNATFVPTVTVDAKGHVTSIVNTAITFPPSGVTSVAGKTGAVLLDTYDITENLSSNLWFTAARVRANISNTAPINYAPSTGVISHADSGVTASGYGDAATVPKVVVDVKGHVTSIVNTAIAISASQITSGTLAVARGGTGQTAITVNGSLLIGNTVSGGFDVNPLTQGDGVLVTNNKGAITIAANSAGSKYGSEWVSRTSATDNDWQGIAWNGTIFVAVSSTGTGNRVMTSPDGITWTSRVSAADNAWNRVAWNGTVFAAVASTGVGNRVMTSPDGISWTSQTSAADNSWIGIAWNGTVFAAVSSTGVGNRVMTSPDGISWTSQLSAADNSWAEVAWNGTVFVAVAFSGVGNRVMTSPDGITWTIRTSAADNSWIGVAWNGTVFAAVAVTGAGNRVMTSPDGITWTIRSSAVNNPWIGIAWNGTVFAAVSNAGVGDRVMTSPDGITWTSRTKVPDNAWNTVAWNGTRFAAVATSGTGNRVMTTY